MNVEKGCLIGCGSLSLFGLFLFLFAAIIAQPLEKPSTSVSPTAAAPNSSPSTSSIPSTKQSFELEALAMISDDNRSISITNMNDFTWKGVTVEVNGGAFSGGYKKKVQDMKFLDVLTIDLRNLAKKDGTRFNPYTMKVNRVMIEATTPKGKKFYVGDFE